MGSGEWRSPPGRVATDIPTGQKPFWPLADGKERVLECGEIRAMWGVLSTFQERGPFPDDQGLPHLSVSVPPPTTPHLALDSQDFPEACGAPSGNTPILS